MKLDFAERGHKQSDETELVPFYKPKMKPHTGNAAENVTVLQSLPDLLQKSLRDCIGSAAQKQQLGALLQS